MPNILMSIFAGIFWIGICLIKDHSVVQMMLQKAFERFRTPAWKNPEDLDEDVRDESQRIMSMNDEELKNGNLALKGLSKFYGNNLVVNQLNLKVNNSECFGLLGKYPLLMIKNSNVMNIYFYIKVLMERAKQQPSK
jgi:hypothetical protein